MFQRGIRGAITVDDNTIPLLRQAVIELILEIKKKNNFKDEDIACVMFTMTEDLDCIYPAKIAREEFEGWENVPLMCMEELRINNSLKKCLRVLILINTELAQSEINHVYLKGAKKLREDLI